MATEWKVKWSRERHWFGPWWAPYVAPEVVPMVFAACDVCRYSCTIAGAPVRDLVNATFEHCKTHEPIPKAIQEQMRATRSGR